MARARRSRDLAPRHLFVASGVIAALTVAAWAIAIAVDDVPGDRLTLLMIVGLPLAAVALVSGVVLAIRGRGSD